MSADPMHKTTLTRTEARRIFAAFAAVPVRDDGRTREAFRQFSAGTRREDVWRWLENACPAFSVAQEVFA